MTVDAERLRRLRWRCRRGMRELDVLLTRYVDSRLSEVDGLLLQELSLMEQFLDLQDPELQRYLLAGEVPSDPKVARLAAHIRAPARIR